MRAREEASLSPLATRSYPALRTRPEPICGLRTPFQRDRDRIVHCKAFRRLKDKTQVFVAPSGDHYRTRLTHTLEVTQVSRTVARALDLNEDLVEAIGLGHDLGHPPFGHVGEEALDRCLRARFGRELPPPRALAAGRRNARARRPGAQPDGTGSRRDPRPFRAGARAGDARGQDRPADRSRRLHQPRHRRRRARRRDLVGRPAGGTDRDPRRHRSASDRHARPRPRRALARGGRDRSGRAGRRSDARSCARSCSSASTSGLSRPAST